jgi:hypothetical protein
MENDEINKSKYDKNNNNNIDNVNVFNFTPSAVITQQIITY